MRCSICSHEVNPVVALDIDGTLGDYHGHFIRFSADWLGVEQRPSGADCDYDGSKQFKEWWCRYFKQNEKTWHDVKLAYRQGGMKRTMPIFDGARALCWVIRDAGAELWLTTTRPYLSLDNVVPDTVEWCRRNEIEFDGLLFDDDKYRVLAERVDPQRVVAVFDDIGDNVYAANLYFPERGWLLKNNYNRSVQRRLMCDLDSAADIAVRAIKSWKVLYA